MTEAGRSPSPPQGCRSVAILAGGRAERLGGATKGLLEMGGRKIIDRQLAVLTAVFEQVFLVTNDPAIWSALATGVRLVPDRSPGAGPLAGIDAALSALPPEDAAIVCVGGDMPFLEARSLITLRDHPGRRTPWSLWSAGIPSRSSPGIDAAASRPSPTRSPPGASRPPRC